MSFFTRLFQKISPPAPFRGFARPFYPAPPMPKILPPGIRLNNPGNMKRGKISWHGMSTLQDDPVYIRFETLNDGLRAMMVDLINCQRMHNLYSVRGIINRWAPPIENKTGPYVMHVAKFCGLDPDEHLDSFHIPLLMKFSQAIAIHENGHPPAGFPVYWYPDEAYAANAASALTYVYGRPYP